MELNDAISSWYREHLNATIGPEAGPKWSGSLALAKMGLEALIDVQLSGTVTNIYTASSSVKQRYNEFQKTILDLETEAKEAWHKNGLPDLSEIDPEAEERYRNLDFIKKERSKFNEVVSGWYQNSVGVLYHYDGVIWDEVPKETINDLEYLG